MDRTFPSSISFADRLCELLFAFFSRTFCSPRLLLLYYFTYYPGYSRYGHSLVLLLVLVLFSRISLSLLVMVVGVGLLINAVLVAIPVGGSVGALMGIDAHRAATGQKPLFTGGTNDDSGGGTGTGGGSTGSDPTPHNNGITTISHCDLSYGIVPPSKTEQYTRKAHTGWNRDQ